MVAVVADAERMISYEDYNNRDNALRQRRTMVPLDSVKSDDDQEALIARLIPPAIPAGQRESAEKAMRRIDEVNAEAIQAKFRAAGKDEARTSKEAIPGNLLV